MPEPIPLPLEVLVDALQDRVHEEKGKLLKAEPIRRCPMPEFLLTEEEMVKVYFESEATPTLTEVAMCKAQLRKVALWLDEKAMHHNGLPRFNREEWEAFKREAGLEKEAPDA